MMLIFENGYEGFFCNRSYLIIAKKLEKENVGYQFFPCLVLSESKKVSQEQRYNKIKWADYKSSKKI